MGTAFLTPLSCKHQLLIPCVYYVVSWDYFNHGVQEEPFANEALAFTREHVLQVGMESTVLNILMGPALWFCLGVCM